MRYKVTALALVFIMVSVQTFAQREKEDTTRSLQTEEYPWTLVFEDKFDGDHLDDNKWRNTLRIRYCNNEQQYYTYGDNVEVSDGTLKIIAKQEPIYAKAAEWLSDTAMLDCFGIEKGINKRHFQYTSANIETRKKFHYGKYEASVKIPKGKGFWPAFWLFGDKPVYNEIDIFEFFNTQDGFGSNLPRNLSRIHHMTVHYDHDGDGRWDMRPDSYKGEDFSQDFHVFTLIWEPDSIAWYVDGDLKRVDYKYYTKFGDPIIGEPEDDNWVENEIFPSDPMHIIFNLAIRAGNDAPNRKTIFPSQMEVDWVRYYR